MKNINIRDSYQQRGRIARHWPAIVTGLCVALGTSPMASSVEVTQQPLGVSVNVPGNLVLVPSVEFPTVISVANINDKYSAREAAVGYFDPNKCYRYHYANSEPERHFYPSSVSFGRNCTGAGEWSGHYLNWVGTQTIDPFRSALTGGYRVVDEVGTTIVEKARHDRKQTNSFPRRETEGVAVVMAATPAFWDRITTRVDGLGKQMYFGASNSDVAADNVSSEKLVDYNPAIHRLDFGWLRVGNKDIQANQLVYAVSMRVKVCDIASKPAGVAAADWLEPNCKKYSEKNYKPEGLIQEYSHRIRYAVFSYLNDHSLTRDGGVMRARMKYVGPKSYDPSAGVLANAVNEWDGTTGILRRNPDSTDATTTGVADSGVINYINKFGEIKTTRGLKGYDPVGELFYSALRYLKGQEPVSAYSSNFDADAADGFPVITQWDTDPLQYSCQTNVMLGIGDANTWVDKNLPGITSSIHEPSKPAEVTKDDTLKVDEVLARILRMENTSLDEATALSNARSGSFSGRNNSAYIAALAYDAHVNDIRPDDPTKKQTQGRQTVSTHWVDVLENRRLEPAARNQYYLATKYGGFTVPSGYDPLTITSLDEALWSDGSKLKVGDTELVRPRNYYAAADAERMVLGLRKAFENIIAQMEGSGSSLASNSTRLDSGTMVYQATFSTGSWHGDLAAFEVNPVTGAVSNAAKWSAAAKLPGWASRNITVNAGGRLKPFTYNDLTGVQKSILGSVDVVDYLRGNRALEGSAGLRVRAGVLGSIINSQPIYVGRPKGQLFSSMANNFKGRDSYADFVAAQASRRGMVYVGGNDGMLHGFDAETGEEKFAFVPNAAISDKLRAYTQSNYAHRYFVDGELTVADAYDGSRWRTVLVGTMGRGGKAAYALDVTNPDKIQLLWEKTGDKFGNSLGKPIIAQVADGDWRVLIGNGPNSNSNSAALVMIELFGGGLQAIDVGGVDNGLSGIHAWDSLNANKDNFGADGITDYVYAGDLNGNIWRFSPAIASNSSGNTGLGAGQITAVKIFSGQSSQPIQVMPLVGRDPVTKETWVYFGTGRYLNADDLTDKRQQSWYGVIDKFDDSAPVVRSDLLARSITDTGQRGSYALRSVESGKRSDLDGKRGWYIDLPDEGERMVLPNQFLGYVLVGATRTPDIKDPCQPGGKGYVMAINPFTGARLEHNFFDISGDGRVNVDDSLSAGSKTTVSGVGFGMGVNNPTFIGDVMQLSFENATLGSMRVNAGQFGLSRVSWREWVRD